MVGLLPYFIHFIHFKPALSLTLALFTYTNICEDEKSRGVDGRPTCPGSRPRPAPFPRPWGPTRRQAGERGGLKRCITSELLIKSKEIAEKRPKS